MISHYGYLQLSGIQHFVFCRRQWALIFIENQWADNLRTVEGTLLHEKAHDPTSDEKRKDIIIVRGMPIKSDKLRITGICDVVEFIADENGIHINNYEGKYKVYPIEYKRGEPKENEADILQLVAQAICLEEKLCCSINEGAIYYGKTRRRQKVQITDSLRNSTTRFFKEMHEYTQRQYTPKVKPTKSCNACSLKNICLPKLMKSKSVKDYIANHIADEKA
ncbi:MAG TPA: CRISPR-associated protein Cas4 [Clostridiales bacterium]|nr:CRISPR-associated protein Cas4 [Clostridiales bacterium]HXK83282.1 CRISPR-associated protein Cas4 [Clostridiales bacterium]